MCKPAAARARTADSRPEPGPFTRTSTLFIPNWSRAELAAENLEELYLRYVEAEAVA